MWVQSLLVSTQSSTTSAPPSRPNVEGIEMHKLIALLTLVVAIDHFLLNGKLILRQVAQLSK